jgi:hypothetical protein
LLQPLPLLPVTVYTVVIPGETLTVFVSAPVLQVYEVAPLAVNTVEPPVQIPALLTETVGVVVTFTVLVIELLQLPLLPETVYCVVTIGDTLTVLVRAPVLQV